MGSLISSYLIDILLALLTLTGCWALGRLCRRALIDIADDALAAVYDFGIGSWLIWTIVFFAGLFPGYRRSTAIAILIGLIVITGWQCWQTNIRAIFRSLFSPQGIYDRLLIFICGVIVLLAAIGALTPPAAQDALVHHLALPKTLIKAGHYHETPYDYFSYFPAGMEMLFLYGLLLHGAGLATLLHWGFGIATFLALVAGARAIGFSSRTGLIAGTAYLTIPTVWMEMGWAYVDLAITFYITLTIIALLCYRKERATGWLVLLGFSLGGALSIKYTALFVVIIISLFILLALKENNEKQGLVILRSLFLPMIIALMVSVVWFIRNIIYTGNPLFPFFLNIIPSHNVGWDGERARYVLMILGRYGGDEKGLLHYLLLPFKLSFLARYESVEYFQGIIGPFFIFAIPLMAFFKRIRREAFYLIGFATAFFLFWLTSSQQIRYLLPALPPLALGIAAAAESLSSWGEEGRRKIIDHIFAAIALIVFLINFAVIIYYFKEFKYGQVLMGQINKIDYLRGKFDYYGAFEYINSSTPPDSKIFLVDTSNQTFYLERDYFGDSVFEDYTLKRIVAAARSPEDIKAAIDKMGITHLIYRPSILFGANTTPFTPEERALFVQYLNGYCEVKMHNSRIALFSIQK